MKLILASVALALLFASVGFSQSEELTKTDSTVRFATFNISFHRRSGGELAEELALAESEKPKQIAEIIQRVRPDVILLNEFDFDKEGQGIKNFLKNHLGVSQNGQKPIAYEFTFAGPVNTGVKANVDMNDDGEVKLPDDAFGFGWHPGQYGMVVLSQFPIDTANVRTFQKFLWKDMPGNLLPIDPGTDEPYYNEKTTEVFRLSSKSHWDVPIKIGDKTIHFLTAHPTPPVFDNLEDRNGRRNHDEIRMFADFVTPGKAAYIYDDNGKKGGLEPGAHFVIAGDMNADESDGDSYQGAAEQLTKHELINHTMVPSSSGGQHYSQKQGKVNQKHKGDPTRDTGDFSDSKVGNLRLDYCLPSKTLILKKCGVYWPETNRPGANLVKATDHRMVWIDLKK